jgi:hypothetical protein
MGLMKSSFPLNAIAKGFTCAHSFTTPSVELFFGMSRWSEGTGCRKGTLIVATADLRAPIECLIASNYDLSQLSFEPYLIPCRFADAPLSLIMLHFRPEAKRQRTRVDATIRIVDLIFSHSAGLFQSGRYAVIGPHGLTINGGIVAESDQALKTAGPLLEGVRRIGENCRLVWNENQTAGGS